MEPSPNRLGALTVDLMNEIGKWLPDQALARLASSSTSVKQSSSIARERDEKYWRDGVAQMLLMRSDDALFDGVNVETVYKQLYKLVSDYRWSLNELPGVTARKGYTEAAIFTMKHFNKKPKNLVREALKGGHLNTFKALLEHIDVSSINLGFYLSMVVSLGHIDIVKYLVDELGVDPNNDEGLLEAAINSDNTETAAFILSKIDADSDDLKELVTKPYVYVAQDIMLLLLSDKRLEIDEDLVHDVLVNAADGGWYKVARVLLDQWPGNTDEFIETACNRWKRSLDCCYMDEPVCLQDTKSYWKTVKVFASRGDHTDVLNRMLVSAAAEGETKYVKELLRDPRVDPTYNNLEALLIAKRRRKQNAFYILFKDPRVQSLDNLHEIVFNTDDDLWGIWFLKDTDEIDRLLGEANRRDLNSLMLGALSTSKSKVFIRHIVDNYLSNVPLNELYKKYIRIESISKEWASTFVTDKLVRQFKGIVYEFTPQGKVEFDGVLDYWDLRTTNYHQDLTLFTDEGVDLVNDIMVRTKTQRMCVIENPTENDIRSSLIGTLMLLSIHKKYTKEKDVRQFVSHISYTTRDVRHDIIAVLRRLADSKYSRDYTERMLYELKASKHFPRLTYNDLIKESIVTDNTPTYVDEWFRLVLK